MESASGDARRDRSMHLHNMVKIRVDPSAGLAIGSQGIRRKEADIFHQPHNPMSLLPTGSTPKLSGSNVVAPIKGEAPS